MGSGIAKGLRQVVGTRDDMLLANHDGADGHLALGQGLLCLGQGHAHVFLVGIHRAYCFFIYLEWIRGYGGTWVRRYENSSDPGEMGVQAILVPPYLRTPAPPKKAPLAR